MVYATIADDYLPPDSEFVLAARTVGTSFGDV